MIEYNTEGGRTLVKVGDWKDMYERVGFEMIVDEREDKLKEVLARYTLKNQNACGLKSCRRPHNRGYLVILESGKETNIGNICGKKHFGIDFEKSKNEFTKAVNSQKYRENIFEKKYQLGGLRLEIQLQRENIDQINLYERMHGFVERILDSSTSEKLKDRARRNASIVSVSRRVVREEATIESFEDRRQRQEDRHLAGGVYREETAFIIAGIEAVISYKKLSSIAYNELVSEMDFFSQINPDDLDYKSLVRSHKWSQSIDGKIRALSEVIENCKRFMVTSNIQKITQNKFLI